MLSTEGNVASSIARDGLPAVDRGKRLEKNLAMFFRYAEWLALSRAEQHTLLDIGLKELLRLQADPAYGCRQNAGKLERRVDYAIPLLHRMMADSAH